MRVCEQDIEISTLSAYMCADLKKAGDPTHISHLHFTLDLFSLSSSFHLSF